MVGEDILGDLTKLIRRRQRMVNHDEGPFEFGRDRHDRREHDDKRPALLARDELLKQVLNDLGTVQEPMEIRQDEQHSLAADGRIRAGGSWRQRRQGSQHC